MAISGNDEIGRLEKSINILRRRAQEAAKLRKSLEAAVLARTSDVVSEMRSANVARAEAEELGPRDDTFPGTDEPRDPHALEWADRILSLNFSASNTAEKSGCPISVMLRPRAM